MRTLTQSHMVTEKQGISWNVVTYGWLNLKLIIAIHSIERVTDGVLTLPIHNHQYLMIVLSYAYVYQTSGRSILNKQYKYSLLSMYQNVSERGKYLYLLSTCFTITFVLIV